MQINKDKLDIALANSRINLSDLRGKVSSTTLAKIRNDKNHNVTPKTVGKLAQALEVPVSALVEQGGT